MTDHFINKCKECGTVISQCRCPSPGKAVYFNGLCEECKGKGD